MLIKDLKGKKIALLGLGIEGLSTASYFVSKDIPFTIVDEKPKELLNAVGEEWERGIAALESRGVSLYLGKPLDTDILAEFDVVVRSPGISINKSFIQDMLKRGVEVISQTKLFFDNCRCDIIGVTGTKGKGTTSTLIYEMLKKEGIDAYLGGNIGKPFLSFLDIVTPQSKVVLELSSFQLQDLTKSPHIAVMLMTTSEHLDYHKDREEYLDAKRNILRHQKQNDIAILNIDYEATKGSSELTKGYVYWVTRFGEVPNGAFVKDGMVIYREDRKDTEIVPTMHIFIPGEHNLENVCAATVAAMQCGVKPENIAAVLRDFKGLVHRLEFVREVDGVNYYDDSFATTPEPAIAAIQAFSAPKVLILGGSSKGADFTELGKVIANTPSIRGIIGIGVEWDRMKLQFPRHLFTFPIVEGCHNMKEIITEAKKMAKSGDIVLLSPACASFGMFKNYKERGNLFKQEVNLL